MKPLRSRLYTDVCLWQAETSLHRAKVCSRAVAADHLQRLTQCLVKHGIYDPHSECFINGKEANVIWLDEMGQFFSYLLQRRRRVTGSTGKAAKTACKENRGTFTVDAALGYDNFLYDPHLLFAQDSLSSDMAPACVTEYPFMLISNTAKGVQTGATWHQRMQVLETQARSRGVTGTIVYVTDGHASRFFRQHQKWLTQVDDNGGIMRDLYITPPNATGMLCVLDQVFQDLHRAYANAITDLKREYGLDIAISKYEAIQSICHTWRGPFAWLSERQSDRAWRVCGIPRETGHITVTAIPAAKYALADKWEADLQQAVTQQLALTLVGYGLPPVAAGSEDRSASSCSNGATPSSAPSEPVSPPPSLTPGNVGRALQLAHATCPTPEEAIRRGTPEYFVAKIHCMQGHIAEMQAIVAGPPRPIADSIARTNWFQPQDKRRTTKKITQEWGSMLACAMHDKLAVVEAEEQEAAATKTIHQEAMRILHEACKDGCTCTTSQCKASNLYLCLICRPREYKRGWCTKKVCKQARHAAAPDAGPLPKKKVHVSRKRKANVALTHDVSDSDANDGSASDGTDGDVQSEIEECFSFIIGDRVKVWWGDLDRWLVGEIQKVTYKTYEIYYEEDDTVAVHHKDRWTIERDAVVGDSILLWTDEDEPLLRRHED